MAKQDWHLTTARLSAFIDGQLSPQEQAQSEEHLRTCEFCQQQLAELRQTVALLHALPQPKLPRSFTLPVAEPRPAARTAQQSIHSSAPVTPLRSRRAIPSYLGGTVRVVSTLAAVIGIVFLLSGLFGTVIVLPAGGGITSAGSASNGAAVANTPQKSVMPRVVSTRTASVPGQDTTPSPTNAPSATNHASSHDQPTQPEQPQPLLALFDMSLPTSRAILGIVLVALGIIGFVVLGRRA